jgi:hypothetical protein
MAANTPEESSTAPSIDDGAQSRRQLASMTRAILTDVHFWVPFAMLVLGVVVLVICART